MRYSEPTTIEDARKLLNYNPDTGVLIRKSEGKIMGFEDHKGYLRISLKRKNVIAHRAIIALYYGYWPKCHVDHIDGDKKNNRILNLRLCDHNSNQYNQPKRKNNKSGYKGVCFMKAVKKWHAQICKDGKIYHLGLFVDKVDAAKAYDLAAQKYHGEFAYLNFPINTN